MSDYRYCLRGDVDLDAAPRVRAELAKAISKRGVHLLIDCTSLTFIDSTGITVLLEAHHKLAKSGRHMLIVNVPRGPRRVFELLGLTDLLRVERDDTRLRVDRDDTRRHLRIV